MPQDVSVLRRDIIRNLTKGVSRADIVSAAREGKWTEEEINEAFKETSPEVTTRRNGIKPAPLHESTQGPPPLPKTQLPYDLVNPATPFENYPMENFAATGGNIEPTPERAAEINKASAPYISTAAGIGAALLTGGAAGYLGAGAKVAPFLANTASSIATEGVNKLFGAETSSILKTIFDDDTEASSSGAALSTLENVALGWFGDGALRVGKAIGRVVKEHSAPGSIVGPMLAKLSPAFSGYFEKTPTADLIEASVSSVRNKKEEIDKEVGKRLVTAIEDFIQDSTGVKVQVGKSASGDIITAGADRTQVASIIQKIQNDTFDALTKEAKARGASVIAKTKNLAIVPAKLSNQAEKLDSTIKELINISPDNTVPGSKAGTILRKLFKTKDVTETVFDAQGGSHVVSKTILEPQNISMEAAWDLKQQLGDVSFGAPHMDMSQIERRLKPLYFAIDNDIEAALKAYNPDVLKSYQTAKSLVNQRHVLFNPGGKVSANTRFFTDNLDLNKELISDPTSHVLGIVRDPLELQRSINSGNVRIPDTAGKHHFVNPQGQDLKSLYRATDLQDIFQKSLVTDEAGNQFLDPQKAQMLWADPKMTASRKILYPTREVRDDISQFLKDAAFASKKVGSGGTQYWRFKVAAGSLGAAAGIGKFAIAGGALSSGAIAGAMIPAVYLSGGQLAKIMTSKNGARLLASAIRGAPLGTSEKVAARLIMQNLKGETVYLMNSDGSLSHSGKVQDNGVIDEIEQVNP